MNSKKQRNKITSLLRAAKKQYISKLVNGKKDSKTIWKGINCVTNKTKHQSSINVNDISVENLNHHFSSVANKIIQTDNSEENNLNELKGFCVGKNVTPAVSIPLMSVNEVYRALIQLKQSGTRGLDGIDGKILKTAAPVIADSLTYVYNLCIEKHYFPKMFKEAKVIPLHKSGSRSDPSNYRPISILSVLSKPLEKHINSCLLSHLDKFNLIHDSQSGFRKHHSCHTALINLVDRWLHNMNINEYTGVLFVDFAKAFDVIDHKLLLRKLKIYGFPSDTLQFISSFLDDRQQQTAIGNTISTPLPIKFGVPQGSILGPLLFSLYINDLPLFLKALTELFADDTSVHSSHSNLKTLFKIMQDNIDFLIKWTHLNHMSLHPNKTKFMLISTRQKKQNIQQLPQLFISNHKLEIVDCHKILGITIDDTLSWTKHTVALGKALASKLYQFSKIKNFLDFNSRKIFFSAYIQSNLDYCSTLWDSASENTLKHISSLHRRALKIVKLKNTSLTSNDYKQLNLLPLKHKFFVNKAVLMFKILSGAAPSTLTAKFMINEARHTHKIMIPPPRIDLYKSSLVYSGGVLWNNLPKYIKDISSLPVFCRSLHTYLMNQQ